MNEIKYCVARIGESYGEIYSLYENIDTIQEAELLAQYVLSLNSISRAIVAIVTQNAYISKNTKLMQDAEQLAKKYINRK